MSKTPVICGTYGVLLLEHVFTRKCTIIGVMLESRMDACLHPLWLQTVHPGPVEARNLYLLRLNKMSSSTTTYFVLFVSPCR